MRPNRAAVAVAGRRRGGGNAAPWLAGLSGSRRSSSPCPAASRCRATARSTSRSASVCADPTCSMSRAPRYWECTICTARAPEAVFTVRTYATAATIEPARLVRACRTIAPGHRLTNPKNSQPWPKSGRTLSVAGVAAWRRGTGSFTSTGDRAGRLRGVGSRCREAVVAPMVGTRALPDRGAP
jgi:hypothetical protein